MAIFALIFAVIAAIPAAATFLVLRYRFGNRFAPLAALAVFFLFWVPLTVGIILNPPGF